MNAELKNALEQIGWDELYSRFIPDLTPANERGERRSRSPFPDVVDRVPSFGVNVVNGLWRCWSSNRSGNYVQFRAIIGATEFDENGLAQIDYGRAQRDLMVEFDVSRSLDLAWVGHCRDVLNTDPAALDWVRHFKPLWDPQVLYSLNIGYDFDARRIVIPVQERNGTSVNARMYRPGFDPKMVWSRTGLGGNFLFPHSAWTEQYVILMEGEPDVLTLRSLGFSACSGTLGAGTPVPDGEWFRRKHVWVWMDADQAGQDAEVEAVARIAPLATEVRVVKLPDWQGRPEKADASDWLRYLSEECGYDRGQLVDAVNQLLAQSELVNSTSVEEDLPAHDVEFSQSLLSDNVGQRIRFVARVIAKSQTKFLMPQDYTVVCPAEGHRFCRNCPMQSEFHGSARFTHDARLQSTLKMIQVTEEKQMETVKQLHGIVKQCPEPELRINNAVDIDTVILMNPVIEGDVLDITQEMLRHQAYVITRPGHQLIENHDYVFEGRVYPHPKNQQGVFLLDTYSPHASRLTNFVINQTVINDLEQFKPGPNETAYDKLHDIARDLEESVTMIHERRSLHLIYRAVFHSAISFMFSGSRVERGWMELLVIGDTRCGKSATYKKMARHYGVGVLVDCKSQTLPGIMGTVVQSPTGEYYVVAGIMPQQDGRIICFDEFHVPKFQGGTGLIDALSSTRSEGTVRITKAASAEFPARVRSIWLANPGAGKLMSELPGTGVEVIPRVINQPEDIARFDIALALSQTSVDYEVINTLRRPSDPKYSQQACRNLIAWVYSRKPHQITFDPAAEDEVIFVTRQMVKKYNSTIPLVEPADQRIRVAKLSVAVAASLFSHGETYDTIVVKPDHVRAAHQLFTLCFDAPEMEYDEFSRKILEHHELQSKSVVQKIFEEDIGVWGERFAEELLRLDEFTERSLLTIVPAGNVWGHSLTNQLYAHRCIQLCRRGARDSYEKTPAFTKWLREYVTVKRLERHRKETPIDYSESQNEKQGII